MPLATINATQRTSTQTIYVESSDDNFNDISNFLCVLISFIYDIDGNIIVNDVAHIAPTKLLKKSKLGHTYAAC